ncbi:MAG: NAD(P)H-hydrate dehydratase [Bacilli bacterium]
MMKEYVITTKEATEIDQKTCELKNLTNLDLIKNAGLALEEAFLLNCKPKISSQITVISGSGHNGADGLMLGYLLSKKGYQINFIVINVKENLKPENQQIIANIEAEGKNINYFYNESFFEEIENLIKKSDYLIDAILGTGLNKEITGYIGKVIDATRLAKFIFSIDIPSGINGDNGLVYGTAVSADLAAVIEHYKAGNLLNQAQDYTKEKMLVKIGLSTEDKGKYILKENYIQPLPKRKNYSHKYNYGNLLIIGGSLGMTGAPLLTGAGALRTGAGLVTLALPNTCASTLKGSYPEIITNFYKSFDELLPSLEKRNAFTFGPGLGRKNPDAEAILNELLKLGLPLVIDADGIYYFKKFKNRGRKYRNVIITPHLGELAVFTGLDSKELEKRSLEVARAFVEEYEFTLVLKGPCTIIADKNETWFSANGNPGLATAGSGDVLTGIITSLLGQGYSPLDAAKTGVYLHSLAGNLAKEKFGEAGLIASDIIAFLPEAIKKIT